MFVWIENDFFQIIRKTEISMGTLNKDILSECLQFCDFEALIKLRLTNRSTNQTVDEILKKNLLNTDWGNIPLTRITFAAIFCLKRFPYCALRCQSIIYRYLKFLEEENAREQKIKIMDNVYTILGHMEEFLLTFPRLYQTVIEKLLESMIESNVAFINHIDKIVNFGLKSREYRKITIGVIEEYMQSENRDEDLKYVKSIAYLYDLKTKIISIRD